MSTQRTSFGLILLLYGAGLGAAAQFAKIATAFPQIQALYPSGEITQGLLLSIISLVGVILGVFAGQIVSALGFRRMLIAGLLLGAGMSAVQAMLPPLPFFMASRIVEGLSHLAVVVAAPTLIIQLTREDQRYLTMTLWSSFFGVAFAAMAYLTPLILSSWDISGLLAVHAGYMALIAGLLYLMIPRLGLERAKIPNLVEILQRHKRAYTSPYESPAALGWLCYTLTYVSVLTVLPPLLPEDQRLALAALMPIASILSSFTLGAFLMRMLPAVTVAHIGFIAAGICGASLLFVDVNGVILVSLFAALGLIQSSSFAVVPQLNKTPEGQALATGALAQMGNLGNMLGTPVLLGLMLVLDENALPVLLIAAYVIGWLVHSLTKRRRNA